MSDWKIKSAGRLDDMGQGLRIAIHEDGDVAVYIDREGTAQAGVEFCNPGGGGGMSRHTRIALLALYEAMRLDAEERPEGVPVYPVNLARAMAEPDDE